MSRDVGVRERPILFSGEMVRAILDGRKTQTRRIMRPQPAGVSDLPGMEALCFGSGGHYRCLSGPPLFARCPYGQPGDRLWCRETIHLYPNNNKTVYAADDSQIRWSSDRVRPCDVETWRDRWRNGDRTVVPSIYMPRWASRLLLEITEVRVQRLHEVTEEDARAEGCPYPAAWAGRYVDRDETARTWYRTLWDTLNVKRGFSWESNPWVWVLTFRRVEA